MQILQVAESLTIGMDGVDIAEVLPIATMYRIPPGVPAPKPPRKPRIGGWSSQTLIGVRWCFYAPPIIGLDGVEP